MLCARLKFLPKCGLDGLFATLAHVQLSCGRAAHQIPNRVTTNSRICSLFAETSLRLG